MTRPSLSPNPTLIEFDDEADEEYDAEELKVEDVGEEDQKSYTSGAPNDFICPITLSLMRNPVCAADGFSYERSALILHLKNKKTSPKTNERMAAKFYYNRTLKAVIDTFKGGDLSA